MTKVRGFEFKVNTKTAQLAFTRCAYVSFVVEFSRKHKRMEFSLQKKPSPSAFRTSCITSDAKH